MQRLEIWTGRLLIAFCFMLAAHQLLITLSTLLSSSLIHPLHDQFRLNLRYLSEPFPYSVLMLENGHRPILPGIARVAELKWLGGWQWIQFLSAWGLAALSSFILMREVHRSWPRVLAVSGMSLVILFIWWNAHARMFIHVYEAVHLFYIIGALVAAIGVLHAASARDWPVWWHLAWLACVAAVFSFGPGIATFAAILVLALIIRAPARVLGTIVLATFITLWVYMFALPGAEGVRNASGGFAVSPAVFHALARLGAPAHEMLRVLPLATDVAPLIALLAGFVIAVLAAVLLGDLLLHRRQIQRIDALGAGVLVFGICANSLIALNRTPYFLDHPDQLFADRYLFWSSVAWLGSGLLVLGRLVGCDWKVKAMAGLCTGMLLVAALPASVWLSGWSSEVYRHVERTSVGMQIDAAPDRQIEEIADAGVPVARQAVALMKERHLAGFVYPAATLGSLRGRSVPGELPVATLRFRPDSRQIVGQLDKATARRLRHEWLWLVDDEGDARGLVAPTHSSSGPRNPFRVGVPTLDGLEGYWIGQPGPVKWLAVMDDAGLQPVARVLQDSKGQAGWP